MGRTRRCSLGEANRPIFALKVVHPHYKLAAGQWACNRVIGKVAGRSGDTPFSFRFSDYLSKWVEYA
jgi:hypothetical protein